jgi:hypothetical protein
MEVTYMHAELKCPRANIVIILEMELGEPVVVGGYVVILWDVHVMQV